MKMASCGKLMMTYNDHCQIYQGDPVEHQKHMLPIWDMVQRTFMSTYSVEFAFYNDHSRTGRFTMALVAEAYILSCILTNVRDEHRRCTNGQFILWAF